LLSWRLRSMIYATESFMAIVVMSVRPVLNSGEAEDKGCCKRAQPSQRIL